MAMPTTTLIIRPAKPADAEAISTVHDAAWRESYRGVIKGMTLERMVEGRGPAWWMSHIRNRNGVAVLDFDGVVSGYVTYGRSRQRSERYPGQIYELYLKPEFQGVGFGRKLFEAARLSMSGGRKPFAPMVVWALTGNERALAFYRRLGGAEIGRRSERLGQEIYETTGFGFG
jgi:ribosomal protein S18 acetylase RimI-like enzyme